MAGSPVNAYRGQQGLSADSGGYHPDPKLLDWIVEASQATHSDPVALLATALQESGGRLNGPAGDKGTSFGPFQFHIGGALGSHPPAWASTYDAVLNRAQEFARNRVHGGPGAAAVQRPRDRSLYAAGVNSLLDEARTILGTTSPVRHGQTPTAAPGSPQPTPSSALPPLQALAQGKGPEGVLGQLQFINTILNPRSSASDLLNLVQQDQGTSDPLGGSAVSPPKGVTTKSKPTPTALVPGDGWGGSKALATKLAQIGLADGLKVTSEKRDRQMTLSGNVSDHWVGNKNAYAYDISNGYATPQMDKAATQIAAALGIPNWHGGVLNVTRGGYKYQVLYRTHVGGDHFTHVHVGVHKL